MNTNFFIKKVKYLRQLLAMYLFSIDNLFSNILLKQLLLIKIKYIQVLCICYSIKFRSIIQIKKSK